MSWIFTVDETVFESEKQKDGSIKLRCSYNDVQYQTIISDFNSCLNPQCPSNIKVNWSKYLLWDLLAEGEPSKDKLSLKVKDDQVILEIKRAHGKFSMKLGEIALDKVGDNEGNRDNKDNNSSNSDKKLIEQLHQQRIQILGQNQIIQDLKAQLDELTERQNKDRDELLKKMLALLNTKKQKIHELINGEQSSETNAIKIKQEPHVSDTEQAPEAQSRDNSLDNDDSETTDENTE